MLRAPGWILASAVALFALGAACGDGHVRPAGEGAGGARAAEPSRGELITGRWRMVAEEPADGKGGFFGQERRLLDLLADGTYRLENYVTMRDGRWSLDGADIVLDGAEVVAVLERVDAGTLVLVEDLPAAYLREGPPRKTRNTYRRVSESELGPMLGTPVTTSAPTAGTWAANYDYGMSKYPTMEIHVTRSIRGAARLALSLDGTATGCFGVASHEHFSESRYSSPDGKDRSEGREERSLLAARGRWGAEGGKARIVLDRFWRDTCDASAGEGDVMGPLELECVAIARNGRLPVPVLGCLLTKHHGLLDHLAINPADTERSGPFVLQLEPRGHIVPDTGRPWLFLGAAPGLLVRSEDGRSATNPEVTFTAAEASFPEIDFRPEPAAGDVR